MICTVFFFDMRLFLLRLTVIGIFGYTFCRNPINLSFDSLSFFLVHHPVIEATLLGNGAFEEHLAFGEITFRVTTFEEK